MINRTQLTFDEIIDILALKYIPSKEKGYSLQPGIYEISDLHKTLEYLLTNFVNVKNTIDIIRKKSKLNNNQTLKYTKNFFSTQY